MKLQNKVAVVTGAATGMGKAIATAMASEGASIVIDYIGQSALADSVVRSIQTVGGKSAAVLADISEPAQVNQLVQKAVDSFGRLDILVNNAGLEYKHPFTEFPFDLWQKVIAVDLTGPFLCAQAAARSWSDKALGEESLTYRPSMKIFPCKRTRLIAPRRADFAC